MLRRAGQMALAWLVGWRPDAGPRSRQVTGTQVVVQGGGTRWLARAAGPAGSPGRRAEPVARVGKGQES